MDTTSTTSRPKYLLAIDPGLSTGIALLNMDDSENPEVVFSHEWTVEEFYQNIETLIEDLGPEVVCEKFIITVQTAKLSQAPWSLELIGITKYLSWKYNCRLTLQKPDEKSFAPNDKVGNAKLKRVGFWHKGGEGHANDAFRHAMVYIVNHYPKWAKRLIV